MTNDVKKRELQVVYRGNQIDSEMISQLLNGNGIETMIKNHLMGSIAPWQVAAGGFEPIEIIVNKRDFERAQELMKHFFPSI